MVVAVAVVRMVQVAIYQIVHVIAVGNGFMTAAGTMNVLCVVARAIMAAGAIRGIVGVYIQGMLIHVIAVNMVQVAVVQVIDVVAMLDGGVAAIETMLMVMVFVFLAL